MVYSLNPLPFPRTKILFRDSLKMILYRIASSSVLHLYKLSSSSSSNFLSGITVPYSLFSISSSSILCSSASLRDHLLWQTKLRQPQARALTTCTSVAQRKGGGDTFFAEESVSWSSIGVSDKLSRSLFNAALGQPSIVQASSIPSILSGKDVVIAAETGSGKTHGYLVPLIEKLYNDHKDDDLEDENGSSEQRLFPIHHKFSLVLCPNVTLCEQVVRMANCLRGDDGKPLLTVAAVCGRQGWPVNKPDIIVSTPVTLLNHIEPKKQRCTEFMRGVKYVVFDEADMLLCGSFQNKVIRLIHLLRFDEKKLSWSKESDSHLQTGLESEPSLNFSSEDEQNPEIDGFMEGEEISEGASSGSLGDDDEAGSIKRIDGWKVRKNYKRSKQYIFVAATLPVNGKKTAGAVLKKMFPEANWVSGNYLHCHNPRLKHRWVEVNVDTQVDELLKAVKEGLKSKSVNFDDGQCRTMVFANTVEAVEAVAKILERAGVECYRFHKDCTLEERGKTLNDFGEKGGILVCTDAAARGVDIPNISHVIQADFATSAVDFLHRVGRTGRAGQYGLVTSLYTESNRDLVAAVRSAEEVSQPVEIAFSRKRSFRNKIKKRGYGTVKDTSRVEESVVAY